MTHGETFFLPSNHLSLCTTGLTKLFKMVVIKSGAIMLTALSLASSPAEAYPALRGSLPPWPPRVLTNRLEANPQTVARNHDVPAPQGHIAPGAGAPALQTLQGQVSTERV